jgi:uracil-DNA glycosylase
MAMEERRRLGYLGAMGIDVWVPRGMPSGTVAAREEGALVASARLVPAPGEPSPSRRSTPPREPEPEQAPAALAPDSGEGLHPVGLGAVESDHRPQDRVSPAPSGMDWNELERAVSGCRACGLCENRTKTVFGVGSRTADLLIIGEAPGAEEDRAGEPFVGRAGQLLNRMLASIGLARDRVYIANVLKCRPPQNRDPRPDEAEQCEGYLLRQIQLIAPRVILCVGRVAARHLLRTDAPLGTLRGRWLAFGDDAAALRVTYHPAYLLRSPEQKAKAWDDLVEVARHLDRRMNLPAAPIGFDNDKNQSD